MKKVLLFLSIAWMMCSCGSKNQFTITGEIVPATEGNLILYKFVDGQPVAEDTTILSDSKFKFVGEVELPSLYLIGKAENANDFIAQLFVEKGKIDMTIYPDSLQANEVEGSKSQDLFQSYVDEIHKFSSKSDEIRSRFSQAHASGNDAESEAIRTEYTTLIENNLLYTNNFIKENSNSPVGAYVYLMNFFQQATYEELDSIIGVFDPSIEKSEFVQIIKQKAEKLKMSAVGATAPNFELTDASGKNFKLSDFNGKYVLINFWASWCQPCMADMPDEISLYNIYKDKGLEVIAISLDRDEESWRTTISEMKMNWTNAWDMKDEQLGGVADLYEVTTIPHSVLIDKEGKIIARELRGEELQAKISSLLD